jgi:hypothetical protein
MGEACSIHGKDKKIKNILKDDEMGEACSIHGKDKKIKKHPDRKT